MYRLNPLVQMALQFGYIRMADELYLNPILESVILDVCGHAEELEDGTFHSRITRWITRWT